jgi:hypothetical protein
MVILWRPSRALGEGGKGGKGRKGRKGRKGKGEGRGQRAGGVDSSWASKERTYNS